jgi:hypothetical protein
MKGILTAATLLCLMEATAMADNTASFETEAVGATPKGWMATSTGNGNPKWTIEQDQTAPSKLKVVKQSGRAAYPLLLKDDTNIKDGFIEMKFKAIAGSEDRAAGLVWRARDANNYYVVRANALEDNVVLYKTVGGVRSPLDIVGRPGGYGVDVTVPANHGLPSVSISKATASGCFTTASSCSRSKTPPSATPERWDCGPRPTA